MKVKICGITNLKDAKDAINAGASALGFVFYKQSPRYIDPFEVRKIIDAIPPFVQSVGLFVNEPHTYITQICQNAKIQLAQIIDEDNYTNLQSLDIQYIKVLRVKSKEDIINIQNEYVLIDAFVESFGGEGKKISLEWFKNIDCSKFILAGGLKKDNLDELSSYNFFGLDVSSSVEQEKGIKDKNKMISFIKKANEI